MKRMKFLNPISNVFDNISLFLFAFATILECVNVFLRYGFQYPLAWCEEITVLFFMLGVFFSQINVEVTDSHLDVPFLVSKIKNKMVLTTLTVIKRLSIPIIYISLAIASVPVIVRNYELKSATVILHIPFWISYMIFTLMLVFVVLINIEGLISFFLSNRHPQNKIGEGQ